MGKAKTRGRLFNMAYLAPAVLCFILFFVYPIARITLMSLHEAPTINDKVANWSFIGMDNFTALFRSSLFKDSMLNIGKVFLIGGLITLTAGLLMAVLINSGVKLKSFWRSLVYLPNIISAVALASMWTQYIYNDKYGLLTSFFSALGLEKLAAINWTSPSNMFMSMLISFCFGCTGYFMLMFLAGIERIPNDLYESASIDGAGKIRSFFVITFPLIRNVLRNCIVFWSITCANFFVWPKLFSHTSQPNTIVPAVHMYNLIFGSEVGASTINVGQGAAVGVVVTLIVVVIQILINLVLPEKDLEY